MKDFIKEKMAKIGISIIKDNPEFIDEVFGVLISACDFFELNENESRNIIILYKNKLEQPQMSIAGIEKDTEKISSIKKSFTSKNLFELLKTEKNE